jgi:hypothetical protein
MKKLIIATVLSLMTSFVYSQNCIFGVYLNSYKNTSKKISFTKRKNLTFYIKTDSCHCFGNNFSFFEGNDLKKWGKLTETKINDGTISFYLLVDDKLNFKIIVEESKITLIENNNGRQKIFVSKKFKTKWLI